MLAFDLVQAFATTDTPFFLAGTNYAAATLTEAPQQIALRFSAGVKVDPTSIANAITVTRSNGLGDAFANGNDIVVTPGYIGVDDAPNENRVIIRFAETLPNDSYRITIGASLKTIAEGSSPVQMFRDGGSFNLNFRLDLGAQVTSVVPQPVIRAKTITFSALPQDGDLLEVAIRGGKQVFEFDGNGSVQSGNTAILIAGKTTANLAADVATAISALSTVPGFTNELGSASAASTTVTVSGANFTPVVKFTRGGTVPTTSPVRVADGALTQLSSKVVVYFNAADPLDGASVVPGAFKLFTLDSTTGTDTATNVSPTAVSYDAASASAVLTFAADLPADELYRLQIGQSSVTPKADVAETDNANSTFTAAKDLGSLSGDPLERISVKVTGSIDQTTPIGTPAGNLSFPRPTGDGTEPGHRDNPAENHLSYGGMTPGQIRVQAYNFNDYYGNDVQGNQLTNVITETQKQRAREIFDIYSRYTGIRFVETADQGITVITGDLRAFSPGLVREPVAGLGDFRSFAAMDSADDWGESEYGGYWFEVAMHEIGHALGLGHAYDIPAIMGDHYGQRLNLDAEPVFPGNYDRVHLDVLYPRAGTDIDLYKFNVLVAGQLTAQTFVSRAGQPVLSKLDSVLSLYREAAGQRELIARNDDYFGRDSFVGLTLQPGTYYVAVTSTGNTNFNPEIPDSGYGGRTDGDYELRLDFSPAASVTSPLKDSTGTPLDGDRDGKAGGEYKFWFQTAANTLFVDKAAYANIDAATTAGANGTLAKPFYRIQDAITAATPGSIIRIVGNTGNAASAADDRPYLIGTDAYDRVLEDGETFIVPKDVAVMIDAGATFKLRAANIDVGSSSSLVDRSGAVLQVLGTPSEKVFFTSFHDDARGGDSDRFGPTVQGGQWGGLVFRGDSDFKKDRVLGTLGTSQNNDSVFLNSVSNASIRYGGGAVVVDSFPQNFAPIHLESTRPSLVFNEVTDSAGAPIAADPNSFEDTAGRVGPEIRGNRLVDNSINGIFVRIRTELGKSIDKLSVPARFRNTDAPYVLTENLLIDGGAGGYIRDQASGLDFTRDAGRLQVDPGVVIKLWRSRIELDRGRAQFIAEGMPNNRVVFTTLADNRFGGAGTFDTNGANLDVRTAGDWGGIIVNAGAKASIDQAYIAFGGGETPIEGRFDNFSVIETHQGDLRLANSRIENNAAAVAQSDRDGRGRNDASTVFVRGAQPIIVGNDFRSNAGAMISVNANSLVEAENPDPGRTTGPINRFTGYDDNRGPLVRANTTSYASGSGALAGMRVRGEEITVESVWEDTDVVHVLQNEIIVQNFHTATGLRLQSSPNASLVVKLLGPNAGFTAAGYGLDIDDRIGGTVQVVGFPTKPVILTSLKDDSVGASYDPLGRLVTDTNGDGTTTTAAAGDWRSLKFLPLSNDRNVAVVNEAEASYRGSLTTDPNGRIAAAQVLGVLAPNFATGTNTWESAQEKSGDENRRLGFEVHGTIALDNPGDNDIYSFQGYSGSEVWFDIDKTSPGLDAMLELLDAAGNVIARSADASRDGSLTPSVIGAALRLTKDNYRGGDYYGTNPRDPGMRVILPTRAGYPLGSLTQYYVRVRSQAAYGPTTTKTDYESGLTATTPTALAAGASQGEYELRIRLRQRDEKPGSTVRSADIRFPTTGIDVLGLPHNSQVLGETAEANVDANGVWTSAQKVGNLLAADRNTISIGGELSSAADIDWFQFDLDIQQIQAIAGVNAGGKTWSMVFDLDYADGFRGDLTISVFDSAGKLIYVGRDSDVAADQPGVDPITGQLNQGNDFDDLSRGSVGKLDPFIGPIQMPATAGRYYVAVSSNEQLPLALNATFRSDAANAQIRLEPVNSLERIVEDHIGSIGYKDSAKQQINPKTGPLIGTTLRETGLTPTEAASAPPLTSTTTTTFALAHTNVTPDSINALISYNDPLFGTTTRWTITTDTTTGVVTIASLGNVLTFAEPVAMLVRGPAGRVEVTWNFSVDPADVQLDEVTYLATGVNPLSAYITPFTLADVTLFLSTAGGLFTHDAVSGALETTISKTYTGLTIGDIDIRPDGKLYAYAGVNSDPATAGQLLELDSGTGAAISISSDGIPNVNPQGPLNFQTTSDTVTAMAFGRTSPGVYKDLWLVVSAGGQSKLYRAADGGSATTTADATANQDKASKFGYQGRIGIDLNNDGDFLDAGERPLVTGLQYIDDVSGTLYGVTADGKLLRITVGTKPADETIDFDAPATVVADYAPDLMKVGATGFTALAAAPQNLYGGALKGKFFALTDTGRLVLINPTAAANKAATLNGTAGLLQRTGNTGGSIYLTGATSGVVSTKATTSGAVVLSGTTSGTTFTASVTLPTSIRPDMLVTGPGVPYNTTVSSLVGGVVTLSQAVSVDTTTADTFSFIQPLSPPRAVISLVNPPDPVDLASATVGLDNASDIEVGMLAINSRLPANTIVTAVDLSRGYVTLSNTYFPRLPGSPRILFVRPDRTELGTLSDASNTITGITTGNLRIGMTVFGDGVPNGARVTNVFGTRIELSAPTTAAGQKTLYFVDGRSVFGIENTAQIRPGMVVEAGPNIAPNTFVTAVNPSGIVLSQGAIGTASLADLRFFQPVVENVSGTAAGTSITIDTTSLEVGMVAVGLDVPANTTILTLGSGTLTLSNAPPAGPVALTFYRDNDGTPVVLASPTDLATAGITTGMLVFGQGIDSNTTVIDRDPVKKTLTLSKPALETISADELRLVSPATLRAVAIQRGNNILTVSTTVGIAVDMVAVGDGIPDGALVTAVNAAAKTVTLEQQASQSSTNVTVRFITPDIVRDGTADPFDATGKRLTISTTNLHVGMLVFGNGVPTGTVITAKAGGTVTLSNPVIPGPHRYAFVRDGRVVTGLSGMANIAVGQSVTGTGIPAGVTVGELNPTDREVTLSQSVVTPQSSNTLTFTGTGVTNAIIGNLSSTANLQVGMTVIGNGITAGTTIQSIDDYYSITLSAPASSDGARDLIFVTAGQLASPAVTRDGDTTSGSEDVTLASVADLRVGMIVQGTNLPANVVIVSRNLGANTITLSAAATATGTDSLKFINTTSLDYLADWSGDYNASPILAAGATGIAFSPLDINLWHTTERRGDGRLDSVGTPDPGHGINSAPDNSRGSTIGGTSMYFGLETWKEAETAYRIYTGELGQYGVTAPEWQRELTTNTGRGDTYDLPGGAHGSLTTNPFSLAGYAYTSKPTLYFNYWLDTEDASGAVNTMRDSARVLISKDQGLTWELVATNNQTRSTTSELPGFPSVSSAISYDTRQHVQELFDSSKTTGWRQARIDLGNYAGEADLRLRFDFHTAGEFDPTVPDPSGAVLGPAGRTGNFTSSERGQRNNFEGFYIDDIIIGFAERGEMVTGAIADQAAFFDVGTPGPGGLVPAQYLMGPYQLEMRRGAEYAENTSLVKSDIAITRTFDTDDDLIRSLGLLGDENQPREQGQFIIEGNWIANAKTYGISIDAGDRDPDTGAPASGAPRKLPTLNNSRLAPGAVVVNNIVSASGTAGIRFSGEKFANLGSELITNGSFELTSVPLALNAAGGTTQTGSTSLVEWTLRSGSIDIFKSGVYPAGTTWPAAAGDFFIDTSGTGPGTLEQTIPTLIGETYTLQFSMAGDPGNAPAFPGVGEKNLRISLVGATTNSVTFNQNTTPVVTNQWQWERKTLVFVADSASTTLRFESLAQNEYGMYLDDVSVRQGIIAPLAAVPYGRIVNNTIYGGTTQTGVGVQVTENAAPTLLNNLFSGLTTAIDVDATSVNDGLGNLRTVIGTSAFHNVGTQVSGTTASQSLTLTGNPFVAAGFANFYLAEGTSAIDSALNTLQDRTEYNVVTSPLGISVSPIVAPDRDIYGQLRGDDPTQASTPGLGSNIFKDRGAVDRVDFTSPFRTLVIPADTVRAVAVVRDDLENSLTASGAAGRGITRLELRLSDRGVGIDPATVRSAAFTLLRGTTPLVLGRDYLYSFDPTKNVVTFEAVTVFAPDSYTLTATSQKAAGAQAGLLTDLANNTLRPNNDDGTLTFAITLSDVPDSPADLTAVSGNTTVSLSWTASAANGSPILSYVIEYSTTGTGSWTNFTRPLLESPTSTTTTVTGLTNGQGYWFRVAAVNALGKGPWSDVIGPVTPLKVLALTLAVDTGLSGDGVTNIGRIDVGGIDTGATWEHRIPGGTWTAGSDTFFMLPQGSYAVGSVEVRQSVGGVLTGAGSNTTAITVDTQAPTISAFSSTTANGTYRIGNPINITATTSEAVQAGATITVTLNTGGTAVLTAVTSGTTLSGDYMVLAGHSTADLAVSSFTASTVRDIAGNLLTSTTVPTGVNNIAGLKAIVVDGIAPTIVSFTSSTANGIYKPSDTINITATTSEAVQAGATITVTLDTGATVTLTRATATTLTGTYTVAAGQNSADLTVTSFTIGTVLDLAGNPLTSTTVPSGLNNIAGSKDIVVDALGPTITSFSSTTSSGSYKAAATINITATTSEAVQAGATITVTLDTGATVTLTRATATTLTGTYTVAAGHNTADLTVTSFTIGAVLDLPGNPLTSTNVPTGVNNIAGSKDIVVDTVAPTITAFSSTTANGSYKAASTINITATTSEAVQAGATITVTLDTGGTAVLTAATQGTTLTGTYTVATGHNTSDLTVTSFTAGTVLDIAGNTLTSTTVPTGLNNIAGSKDIVVDTLAPTITAFSSTTANGSYKAGAKINITATTSEAVQAGATITVTLDTGATVTLTRATATTLTGDYTVAVGHNTADLTVTSFTTGTVIDLVGNQLTSTTVPTGVNNIAGSNDIIVDTLAPAAPTIALAADTGASSSDGVTSNGLVNVAGIEPGAIWQYSTSSGNSWLPGTGSSFTLSAGTYPANSIRVRQNDVAGNTSGEFSIGTPITVDSTTPAAPVAALANDTGASSFDGVTSNGRVNVTGVAPNATWEFSTNGGVTWTAGTIGFFTLPAGIYAANSIQVRQTSLAGLPSGTRSIPTAITVDQSAVPPTPTLAIDTGASQGDGITSNGLVNVAGIEPGATWQYSMNNGGSWTNGADTSFALPAGTYAAGAIRVRQTDLAGNTSGEGFAPQVTIDSTGPAIVGFGTNAAAGTYGPGTAVTITATVNETVQAGSAIAVTLNTGAVVTLRADVAGTVLSGIYQIAVGDNASQLAIVASGAGSVTDVAGNPLTSIASLPNPIPLGIAVDGAIRITTPAGFSSNSATVPDRRVAVTSIPITFNTPVTGLSLSSFRLLLNGRGVSLRGARLTGSGANYTLTLPSRLTNTRGIYTLQITAAGIQATSNSSPMTNNQFIYWGKGRSVGIAPAVKAATFAAAAKPAPKPRAAAFRTMR